METKQLDEKVFEFIPNIKLPVLSLVINQDYDDIISYDFVEGREWLNIQHQTGGEAHKNNYFTGTILKPRSKTHEGMKQINERWYFSMLGFLRDPNLNELLEYKTQLNDLLGVDCNESFMEFEEGIYPIDCSVKNIRKLALDELPDNLDDLIRFEAIPYRSTGPNVKWDLYILGDNCK